jgi:putative hemolysin
VRPGLVVGHNVDRIDVRAGLKQAASLGYGDAHSQMVVEYALMRHARAEEEGAERTALSFGIDFTSWRICLAAARAAAEAAHANPERQPT